jgi:xanthine dehydrogenase accessory factor
MHEFVSVTQAAHEAVQRGEPAVLASVVRVRGSSPRHGGARMLIWPDGRIAGTVGGGTLEWRVIEHARLALAERKSRYTNYVFDTHGGPDSVGLCGGSVDIHIEVQIGEFVGVASAAMQALESGDTVVLASIVREGQSAPARSATRMVIWPDGRTLGSVGDEPLQARVLAEARAVLAENKSRLATITSDGDLARQPVLVHLDLLQPDPTLLIIGAGHVAQPLATMGHLMGMRVRVVDDRAEWANRERFPAPTEIGIVGYEPVHEILGPIPFLMTPTTYVVITTWGYDLPAMEQALRQKPAYIGLVGSPTKARLLFQRLRQAGFTDEAIQCIRAPIGLDVGAESPGEIAISILSEVLTVMRGKTGEPLRQLRGARLDALFANPSAGVSVTDGAA